MTNQNAIVSIQNFSFSYPALENQVGEEWVLNGLDLAIEAGSITALMGPAGSGKSTLALALLGIVPQSTGGRIRGSIQVAGNDPTRTPVADIARSVGLVFQDAESQFLTQSVAEEVAFGLESLGVDSSQMESRIQAALGRVGMSGHAERSPYELSGGQKQRVAIASILAMKPQLLILDEAEASLDPRGAAELQQVLTGLRREQASVLLITNNAEWVAELADQIIILHHGVVHSRGTPNEIFQQVDALHALGIRPPQLSLLRNYLQKSSQSSFQFASWDQAERELSQALSGQAT